MSIIETDNIIQSETKVSRSKEKVIQQMNELASNRDKWIKKNKYYYKNLIEFLKFNIPEGSSIIEIGCGTGYLLDNLKPSRGVGIDISPEMIRVSQRKIS